jgi:phage terminase large subunit GpA-like protein
VLTAGVDVQGNRIECEVVGWGENDRSWSIDYFILRGNPAMPDLWQELDERILKARYRHASGAQMKITSAFVDSGDGNHTRRIYWFCRPRQVRRVFACKGLAGPGQTLIRPRAQARVHRGSVVLRLVGVDTAKESLYANLKEEDGGTGYCDFPSGYKDEFGAVHLLPHYDTEYFEQLTGEKLVTEMDGMTPVRKWVKKRERNEALDCRVYAMAALEDLQVKWKALAKNMGRPRRAPEEIEVEEVQNQPIKPEENRPKPTNNGKKRRRIPGFGWVHG